jgi:hypothetical protein
MEAISESWFFAVVLLLSIAVTIINFIVKGRRERKNNDSMSKDNKR